LRKESRTIRRLAPLAWSWVAIKRWPLCEGDSLWTRSVDNNNRNRSYCRLAIPIPYHICKRLESCCVPPRQLERNPSLCQRKGTPDHCQDDGGAAALTKSPNGLFNLKDDDETNYYSNNLNSYLMESLWWWWWWWWTLFFFGKIAMWMNNGRTELLDRATFVPYKSWVGRCILSSQPTTTTQEAY
jgi:hypothetical protein